MGPGSATAATGSDREGSPAHRVAEATAARDRGAHIGQTRGRDMSRVRQSLLMWCRGDWRGRAGLAWSLLGPGDT